MKPQWNDPSYLRYLIARIFEGDYVDDAAELVEWYIENEECDDEVLEG